MKNNKKIPAGYFVMCVLMNFVGHFFYLFFPGVFLLFLGLFSPACRKIGFVILAADMLFSVIDQIRIVNSMKNSDNPDVADVYNALTSDDWVQSVKDIVDDKTNNMKNNHDENKTE
ncbi:MAG: hypothetical protein IKM61_08725 [Eubacteriaceae bacterium]|nr:hypothetical protein [Eubacteriaceae bacterium]